MDGFAARYANQIEHHYVDNRDLEEKIAAQRSRFNADANVYNIRIAQIPASFVAGFKGMQPHVLFQATEADREDVKISFT